MIDLLEDYATVLKENQAAEEGRASNLGNYYIAADTVSVSEWDGFANVYQVHCPRLFLNESVRDVGVGRRLIAYLGLTNTSRS